MTDYHQSKFDSERAKVIRPTNKKYGMILSVFCVLILLYLIVQNSFENRNFQQKLSGNIQQTHQLELSGKNKSFQISGHQKHEIEFTMKQCGCKRRLKKFQKNPPDLKFYQTTCSPGSFNRGPGQKVISFSFYGDINSDPQYAQWIFNKIEKLTIRPLQGERACIRNSEYFFLKS